MVVNGYEAAGRISAYGVHSDSKSRAKKTDYYAQ